MLSAIDNDKPPLPPQFFERNDDFREFGRVSLQKLAAMEAAESAWKLNYSTLSPARRQSVDYGAGLACSGTGALVTAQTITGADTWRPGLSLN